MSNIRWFPSVCQLSCFHPFVRVTSTSISSFLRLLLGDTFIWLYVLEGHFQLTVYTSGNLVLFSFLLTFQLIQHLISSEDLHLPFCGSRGLGNMHFLWGNMYEHYTHMYLWSFTNTYIYFDHKLATFIHIQ